MTSLRFEDVLPDARLALALTRAHPEAAPLRTPVLETAVRAASARELPRAALAAAVGAGLARFAAAPEALAAAERLRDPGAVVVVAGQQPGLLGGPAMVLAKALAAVALARRIESEFSVPAVPVFWLASEDHDHAEADHVYILGAEGAERLHVPLRHDRTMLSDLPVPSAAGSVAKRAIELLPDGPGRDGLRDALPPRPGETVATWSGRILMHVLGPLGVVVVEPSALRAAAAPVVALELESPGALADSIQRAVAVAVAAGFSAPLDLARSELFFLVEDGRRLSVSLRADGVYETEAGAPGAPGARGSASQLLERLRTRPADFSWNVATRVLAQDVALPVAAQICGPSELAYVALLRDAHELLGVPQPAAVLRPGLTFVGRRVARACERLGIDPAAVVRHGEEAAPPATPLATEGDAGIVELLDELVARARDLPAGRSAAVRRRREGVLRELGLYGAALDRERGEADTARAGRLRTALEALRPRARLQERVASPLPWLARYGQPLIERILSAFADGDAEHVVLPLDSVAEGKEAEA